MRKIEAILIAVIILGCVMKEEPVKTYTARQITEDNVFSYGSVDVKVNPNLDYLNISGSIKKDEKGVSNDPTKREFHIFTRPGLNKIVLIETHTRSHQNAFQQAQDDLTKNMAVIQKGRKPIAGKTWEVYLRALPEFPEQILSAVRQKGISIEQYRCGLEIGVAKVIDRFSRIYISYLKGVKECKTLPQNGSILSDEQIRLIRKFANQFDENITISDQSGG
jgi:hypothetical protein